MDDPRSSDSLAVATVVALVAWAAFDAAAMGHSQISALGTEPGPVDWTALARFILGATVILAAAYTLRIGAVRLDLVALVIWTLGFAYVAFDRRNIPTSELICPPGVRGNFLTPGCTLPWAPGFERMALWFLVSATILAVGYAFRRLRSDQGKPTAA